MTSIQKILRFFVIFSLILFLAATLLAYAYLPERAGILFNQGGDITYSLSKGVFFYLSLTFFTIIQIVLYLFDQNILVLRKTTNPYQASWFYQTWFTINMFIICMNVFIAMANNTGNYSFSSILNIAYFGPMLFFASILSYPIYHFLAKK